MALTRTPCLLSVWVIALFSPVSYGGEDRWQVHVNLTDGSRIIGTPSNESLKIDLGFGALEIPLQRIRVAEWRDDGKTVRVELANDDTITGKVTDEPVGVTVIFGQVTLAMKHIKSLQVRPSNQLGWLPTHQALSLYYPFDRVGDGVVTNRAGRLHAANLNGAKWTNDGLRGGAVSFDGSSRIEVPHHQDLCPATLTLAAWLKPTGNQSAYQVIAAKTHATSWNGGYGFVRMPGDAKNVYFFVNGYTDTVVKAEIPNDKWSHVAGVCDGTGVTIYVNGNAMHSVKMPEPADAAETTEAPPHDAPQPDLFASPVADSEPQQPRPRARPIRHTTAPLCLGSDLRGYAWNGSLDEVILYRRALSDREVQQLFESASASSGRSLRQVK